MTDDPWDDPDAIAWAKDVIANMLPKMKDSSSVVSLAPKDGKGDVKYWVELGASIMLDKPLIVVVLGDAPVAPRLARCADEIVRLPNGVDPAGSEELANAIKRVILGN